MRGILCETTHSRFFSTHTMLHKVSFFRGFVIFACLAMGILEFFALQRVRLQSRRTGFESLPRLDSPNRDAA